MTKEIRTSLNVLSGISKCLLYTSDQYAEYVTWDFLLDPFKIYFRNKLFQWGAHFAEEDMDEIESNGISRDDLRKICEKSDEFRDKTFFEVPEKSSSIYKLCQIFYQDKIDLIRQLCDEFNEIYENCHGKIRSKPYLVHRDLEGNNDPDDFIDIENPYIIIPNLVESIQDFINDIGSCNENVSMKSFVFTSQFQILSTFSNDIKNNGLSQKEIQELLNAWSLLIVNAFALGQLTIKLSQKEIIAIREKEKNKYPASTNDSVFQLLSEYHNIAKYFKKNI